jgi:hypothetical protein
MDPSNFSEAEFTAVKKGSRVILGGESALRKLAEVSC